MLVINHTSFDAHLAQVMSPERPERLTVIKTALDSLPGLKWAEAPRATISQMARVHPERLINFLERSEPASGSIVIDLASFTRMNQGSWEATVRAAGAGISGIDKIMSGKENRVFCLVRPPGHHAEPAEPRAFCILNNVAIAAAHAIAKHDVERIAIFDFDVHHGNGTQTFAWSNPNVLYASSHQYPHYPYSGSVIETGAFNNVINAPLRQSCTSEMFREAYEQRIFPAVNAYQPELIIISAGFDGHQEDPLSNLRIKEDDFGWVTAKIVDLAEKHAGGKVLSMLEGGYNLKALAASALAHVQELI